MEKILSEKKQKWVASVELFLYNYLTDKVIG